MSALLLLIILALLVTLFWQRRQTSEPELLPTIDSPTGWRRFLPSRDMPARRLATWLQRAAVLNAEELPTGAAHHLTNWVVTLTGDEMRAWERATRSFCRAARLDMDWLWDSELVRDADVLKLLEQTILLHTLSYSRACRLTSMTAAVKALREWRAAPMRRRQRRFGDTLHAALVRQGHITVDAQLYLAPERRRRAEAVAAMRQLDADNHILLRETVESILNGTNSVPSLPPIQEVSVHGDQLPALDPRAA